MLLSIGMIVKNEEKFLRKCLESIKPILDNVESELIIADTGSEDGTIDIAKEFTNNVYSIEWRGDFAWARNTTIKRSKGKWYMFIDADEEFKDVSDLIAFFNSGDYKDYKSASHLMYHLSSRNSYLTSMEYNRLFKNEKTTRFIGKIHEYIPAMSPKKKLKSYSMHYGYDYEGEEGEKIRQEKQERNLLPLLEDYKKNPKDLRTVVHIIKQYASNEEYDKQKEFLDICEKICPKEDPQYQFMKKSLVLYYVNQEQYENALEEIGKYFREGNGTQVIAMDMRVLESVSYEKLGRLEESIESKIKILELLRMYNRGELDTSSMISVEVLALDPELKDRLIGNISLYHLKANKFDCLIDFAKEYDKDIKRIIRLCINYSVDNKKYKDLASLYEYIKQHYGEDSKEHLSYQDEIEKKSVSNDVKLGFSEALSEIGNSEDEYIKLSKLRSLYLNKNPETNSMLAYFINSDKDYTNVFVDVITIAMQIDVDFSPFIDKIPAARIRSFAERATELNKDIKDIFIEFIEKNSWLNKCVSIKTDYFFCALLSCLLSNEKSLKDDEKIILFERYVTIYCKYLHRVYKSEIFESPAVDILSASVRFAYYAGVAYDLKNSGDYSGFISNMKIAMTHDNSNNDIVLLVMDRLKKSVGGEENATGNQLENEIATLKKMIAALIKAGDLVKAKSIIDSYKQINPSDPDIEKFCAMLE